MSPRDSEPKVETDHPLEDSSKKLKHISSTPKGNPQDKKDLEKQVDLEKGSLKRRR